MGICLSKKKKAHCSPPPPTHEEKKEKTKEVVVVVTHQHQHQQQMQQPPKVVEETHERKQVFLITPSKKKQQQLPTTQQPEVVKAPEVVEKKAELPMKDVRRDGALLVEEARMAPVRTSSCTKEEVESILIQCGRLSRSSSGKGETSAGGRKYSGSKRSYDFDNERKEEEEWEKGPSSSRPSPRRRAPSRERSNSRERGSSGGRRVSRSPGRRSDGMSSSNSSVDKSRQPGKMVSVPAREKSNSHPVAEDGGMGRRRAPSPSKGVVRSSSPRSRSPANIRASNENAHVQHPPPSQQPQTLSRSSSRKAEHSPYRRNPMAEIDDNVVRAEHPLSRKTEGMRKASSQTHSQQKSKSEQRNGGGLENPNGSNGNPINRRVREQLPSCKAKEQLQQQLREQEIVDEAADAKGPPPKATEVIETVNPRTITRTRSSRRSSRDLDALLGFNPEVHLNPTSYTSLLLEDIQSYHQQNTTFSLPVCVSKACSILEAVADLNSSSSENKVASEAGGHSNNDNCSSNGQMGGKGLVGQKDGFVESEVGVKNDLMEPSFHKYVSVRDKLGLELEPQESAGSNSFVGQPWASTWEPNSVDSSDRCWTSSWSGEEVEGSEEHSPLDSGNPRHQQQKHQALSEVAHELEARGKKHSRSVSMSNSLTAATTSSSRKREFDHRQQRRGVSGLSGNGKSGIGRASSTPVAAAASS